MSQAIEKNTMSPTHRTWYGPLLVLLGAGLWATDTLFRSNLAKQYDALTIVTLTHTICLTVTLPALFFHRDKLKWIRPKQWLSIATLTLGGSILAMLFFTKAFMSTENFNIPILLQKLQPLIAISLAATVLKEKLNKFFLLLAIVAIFGAYLISFGDLRALHLASSARTETVTYTLAAAFIWGACTVASRHLLNTFHYPFVTALRYVIATLLLWLICLGSGQMDFFSTVQSSDLKSFALMALIPGLFALYIYYWGMQGTSASVGTLCELAFPLAAVVLNWALLGSALNTLQMIGTALLIASVTLVNLQKVRP